MTTASPIVPMAATTDIRRSSGLDKPRVLTGYLVFTRLTVHYTQARPPYSAKHHGSVTHHLHQERGRWLSWSRPTPGG